MLWQLYSYYWYHMIQKVRLKSYNVWSNIHFSEPIMPSILFFKLKYFLSPSFPGLWPEIIGLLNKAATVVVIFHLKNHPFHSSSSRSITENAGQRSLLPCGWGGQSSQAPADPCQQRTGWTHSAHCPLRWTQWHGCRRLSLPDYRRT